MIPGYNHNVRYKDRVYHVQTEDSGLRNPIIITHLFFGGTILATQRSAYADILSVEGRDNLVRARMQDQHKTMLRNLVAGVMDQVLARLWGPEVGGGGEAPVASHVTTMPDSDLSAVALSAATASPIAASPIAATPIAASPIAASPIAATPIAATPIAATPIAATPIAASPITASPIAASPIAASPIAASPIATSPIAASPIATSPIAAPRISAPAMPSGNAHPPLSPVGPPPQARPGHAGTAPVARPLTAPGLPGSPAVRPVLQPAAQARSAPLAQPAQPRPRREAPPHTLPSAPPQYPGAPVHKSPFGGDLISDKSLDDVILTYLAEEFLDDPDDKGPDGAR